MWRVLSHWPLLGMAVVLIACYVTMSAARTGDDGPRTFIAALAAVTLGAWLYSLAHHCPPDKEADP